jgi:hypothetical protein
MRGKTSAWVAGAVTLISLFFATACSEKTETPKQSSQPAPVAKREGVTFAADPNPIIVNETPKLGVTTIFWKAPVKSVQVHVNAPSGPLFSAGDGTGSAKTNKWVADGMKFYLQDANADDPTSPAATLATLSVAVK